MVPILKMKIEKMAVFSHQKGGKWGKGAKKSRFQEEIGHFPIFILRVDTNAAKKLHKANQS